MKYATKKKLKQNKRSKQQSNPFIGAEQRIYLWMRFEYCTLAMPVGFFGVRPIVLRRSMATEKDGLDSCMVRKNGYHIQKKKRIKAATEHRLQILSFLGRVLSNRFNFKNHFSPIPFKYYYYSPNIQSLIIYFLDCFIFLISLIIIVFSLYQYKYYLSKLLKVVLAIVTSDVIMVNSK
eukprot:gene3909-2777_t